MPQRLRLANSKVVGRLRRAVCEREEEGWVKSGGRVGEGWGVYFALGQPRHFPGYNVVGALRPGGDRLQCAHEVESNVVGI